jgi:hypothetical protein
MLEPPEFRMLRTKKHLREFEPHEDCYVRGIGLYTH